MTGAEFVQGAFRELHRTLLAEMQPLTQGHLGWRPSPEGNPVGPIFWHFMRTEDGIVHRMQGKRTLFESEGWSEKAGLGGDAQAAALSQDDADRVAQIPKDRMLAYAEAVMESAKVYTESLTDAELDRAPDPGNPRRTVGVSLRSFVLSHGWWHIGEIKYVKGLQGLPGDR